MRKVRCKNRKKTPLQPRKEEQIRKRKNNKYDIPTISEDDDLKQRSSFHRAIHNALY